MHTFENKTTGTDLEIPDQSIIEQQALKFAKEFSSLYKSEKRKREELEVVSNELKDRNEELMDIIFLTSNQLLEPINKIDSNLKFIKEHPLLHEGESVTWFEEAQMSLKKLQKVVSEMSRLYKVKSLRSLFRPTPLDKVMAEVLKDLKTTLEQRGSTVHVEPLPVIETDSVQIRILFHQLIMLATRNKWSGGSSVLNIKADRNARGLLRITLNAQGMDFWGCHFGFDVGDLRNGLDRSLSLCQRISQRLGGFVYAEMLSDKDFSCYVVLPEKNIPLASNLSSQPGRF